jgi:cell division protein ZipA
MDATQLRIILLVAGLILIAAIYFVGRPKRPDQGRRSVPAPKRAGGRVEPTLKEVLEAEAAEAAQGGVDPELQSELDLLERTLATDDQERAHHVPAPGHESGPRIGARAEAAYDRIVTLFIAARAGHMLRGPDLVVAAEKAGLVFGHMSIFHRMVDGHPEAGPVFSVANMLKPGSFDMENIQAVQTPALTFFMTLPGPVPALDAWDMLLPTAQRMAELLDAVVLDEDRNALGRQRIAHIRDELRAYDRKHEKLNAAPKW